MSIYDDKPWLDRYPEGMPDSIEIPFDNGLAMFQATASRLWDSPAVCYFDTVISFGELDAASDALAVALKERGFEAGDRLAACLQNVPQFPIAVLAAWKSGGTLVPINPMLKGHEASMIFNDSEAKAIVTSESLWASVIRSEISETAIEIAITTSELDFLDGEVPTLLENVVRHERDPECDDLNQLIEMNRGKSPGDPGLKPEHIAFLTYTSGTTGPPKGAMNTHLNVVFNCCAYQIWGQLDERDVVLGVSPLSHITGLIGHLGATLLSGAPLLLFYRFDAEIVLEAIERRKATFTIASITVFIALLNANRAKSRDLSSLTKVLSGGAPIPPVTVEEFENVYGIYIHSVYGLTETTSPSHFVPRGVRAPVNQELGALSVGVPIFDTMSRIQDSNNVDLPAGEIGEVVISGPQVVSGYWRKPEETAHALPAGELHTGDVGVMDNEGWFYIVDRRKDQINAAGYKIWPREVEEVLYGHDAVLEAAVIGVPDAYRGETVKAFVVLKPTQDAVAQELIDYCKERLAAYKYPRQVEFLEELPKTASGKILRRELREPRTSSRR